MSDADITYKRGFDEHDRMSAASLYDEAFGAKFAVAIPSLQQRIDFLARTFCPNFCFAAYDQGELVGLAGFHDKIGRAHV